MSVDTWQVEQFVIRLADNSLHKGGGYGGDNLSQLPGDKNKDGAFFSRLDVAEDCMEYMRREAMNLGFGAVFDAKVKILKRGVTITAGPFIEVDPS